MPAKRHNIIYTSALFAVALTAAIILFCILSFDRNGLINYIIRISGKPYLLDMLQQKIITPQKFQLLKIACWVLLGLDVVVITLLYYFRRWVMRGLSFVGYCFSSSTASVIKAFARSSKRSNIAFALFMFVIVTRSLYYMIHFELQYDEMWSYNYFTARPFYFSIFSYNNYPLYELATQLFKWLPFGMKINLRLPALLAGLLSGILLYTCIKNYTRHTLTALTAAAMFACMPVTTFYMLYARGVMFELLFALLSIFSLLYALKSNTPKKYFILYVIANIAGMYSMPTHIYFWMLQSLPVLVYIIRAKKNLLKPFLYCSAVAFTISFMCWLPIIAGSGISFVINTTTNVALVNSLIPDIAFYNKGISTFFTGWSYGLLVFVAATILLLAICKKVNNQNVYVIAFILLLYSLPTLIYVLQHNAIPERSVAFVGFIIPLCFCLTVFYFRNNLSSVVQATAIGVFFIAGCIVSNSHNYMHWSEDKDKQAIVISNLLIQYSVKTCYDNSSGSEFNYYYPALEYYYSQKKLAISLNMATLNSQRYKPLLPTDDYDCIVATVSDATSYKNYRSIYNDTAQGFVILVR